ncbi:Imidazole glycerol phosphate synthase subunit HisH [anaerobic digester metagenome]|uniref:Imidazole glycerol phosphate synthase subunit HisH n=1 Tax=Acetobacterium wieringae TaxID=52694 RepID=A0A5D0WVW0_9FIRM|nr:imidazole glycerol phosphate synthase subunit HisH [Acetobacterium wieringae]TYC88299.1 imidazole glycerol phosphate synthase subunit HisH [Acetobacterium wieringae]URN83088.1 imidazole glycerol phosphate synthase subunit HisH [Acetobacterium wieringae]
MIAIVDYDVGNLKNVATALGDVGLSGTITRDKKILDAADAIILPGVGAFSDAMDNLRKFDLIDALNDNVKKGKILMGICLGMQLLFDKSYEDGEFSGLSYIPGEIVKFDAPGIKIPHMGWNNLVINRDSPLVKNIGTEDYVYFVHSYYAKPDNFDDVVAYAKYSVKVPAIVQKDNVIGMQFHPEKSSNVGFKLLTNFKEMIS